MKKIFLSFSLLFIIASVQAQAVRTTIASGIATNPFIWDCTCLPLPNDSIIINHAVTLNTDFGFTDGAVVINASGSLVGDSPNRAFAFSALALFINNGTFDVARVAFFGGTATNNNILKADSFFTNITTGNGFVSNGDMDITTSYWNTGTFRLGAGAELVVRDNFYNGDSLISGVNAVLVNDGAIRVNQDFANSDTIRGTGQICIDGSSANIGVITGTVDMCDLTGGGPVDLNLGTIGSSVTTCLNPCMVSVEEENVVSAITYPNPVTDQIRFESDQIFGLMIYDMLGKQVYISPIISKQQIVNVSTWVSGTYIYHIITGNGIKTGKFIKA